MDLRLRPKVNPRTDPSLLLYIPSSKRVIVNDLDPELGEGLRHDFPKLRTKGSKQYNSTLQLEFYFNIGIFIGIGNICESLPWPYPDSHGAFPRTFHPPDS